MALKKMHPNSGQPSTADRSYFNCALVFPHEMAPVIAKAIEQDEAKLGYRISRSAFVLKLVRAELERRKLLPVMAGAAA